MGEVGTAAAAAAAASVDDEEEAMSGVETEQNEVDTDVEMEKLVNDMCE